MRNSYGSVHRRVAGLIALTATLIVGGCGSAATSVPTAAPATAAPATAAPATAAPTMSVSSLKVGYTISATPERIAQAGDWFSKGMGIPVTWQNIESGAEGITALTAGSLDISCNHGNPPTVAAVAQGVPIEVFWINEDAGSEALVVRPESGITSVRDLSGKKIGTVIGSTMQFALIAALKAEGIDPKSVNFVGGSRPDFMAAFMRGDLDGVYTFEPSVTEAVDAGGKIIITNTQVREDYGFANWDGCLTTRDFAAAHPDVLQKFVEIEEEAVQYYRSNPAESHKIVGNALGVDAATAEVMMNGYTLPDACEQSEPQWFGDAATRASSGITKSVEATAAMQLDLGRITEVPKDPSAVGDPTFVNAVCSMSN